MNDGKPLLISFENLYPYIGKSGRDSYLTLMSLDIYYEQMFEKIKYFVQQKSNIADVHYYSSIKWELM